MLGSLQDYYGAEALFGIESGRYVGYAYARYQHRPKEQFYGVGVGSSKSNEWVYRLDKGIFGGLLGRSVGANALLGGHASYRLDRYGAGQGSLPSVSAHFGGELPGVGADIDYLMAGGFFEYDSRDTPYPPRSAAASPPQTVGSAAFLSMPPGAITSPPKSRTT